MRRGGTGRGPEFEEVFDLQAAAAEQQAIINSMSDGLWVCDASANVLRINPASARLNSASINRLW